MKVEDQSVDQVIKLLANRRRRRIIGYFLETRENTATLDDLVESVIEDETNSPSPDGKSVTADLFHVHLPMLDDARVIDFDSRSEMVRYWSAPRIETLLDAVTSSEGMTDSDGLAC